MSDLPHALPHALIVAGPTCSGKSALALGLARALNGVVINADSMQVYRELRIITARPTAAEEAEAPHALYGIRPAAEAGHILGTEAALSATKSPAAAKAGGVAVHVDLAPVETGALVGVGQQVVGVGDLREAFTRFGIILIAVGVELLGQLAVGGLDVLLAGSAGHAQNGVGIFCHAP